MTSIVDLLTPSLLRVLALTLLHFLWQGAVIAFLLAASNALLQRRSARSRYVAACAALVAMLALPVVTAGQLAHRGGVSLTAGASPEQASPAIAGRAAAGPSHSAVDPLTHLAPWVVYGWLAGVGTLSVRFLGGWIVTDRLKRRRTRAVPAAWQERLLELAARLRVSQPVRLLESALVEVPTALGILRPVILLPAGLSTGLTTSQIDSLLAHELAHVRRRDCLVNLVQALAETVLFYHPAVWWVSNRIRVERENACDDLAVEAMGDAVAYARALLAMEERRDAAPRLAVAADGGRLWNRISRLFPSAETEGVRAPRWLAATLALGGVLALGAVAQVPETSAPALASAASPAAPAATPSATAASAAKPAPKKPQPAARSKQEPESRPEADADPDDLPLAADGMLSPQQLIAFRIHDVTPEFIGQIAALGFDKASANELLALRIHGVTPEYIRAMTAVFGKRPLEDYTAFKIHGLTPEALKDLETLFGKLSSDDALAMRIHGVDAAFVRSFRDAGYPPLSADEAMALKIHGVAPTDAAAWKALGFATPSVDDLLALRIHGVTPETVRSMRGLGLSDLSIDDAVALRIHGVTPEFVQEIRALGYSTIDAEDLTAFRIHGVTPEYIRKMNGKLGGTLSTDELLSLRIHAREGRDE